VSKVNVSSRLPREYDYAALADILRQIEAQLNLLSEGRQSAYHGSMTAAPTTGTWTKGDWIKNSNPASAGYFGFVCTASGTPGTWKSFGLIA
jgi:hypothetical protein